MIGMRIHTSDSSGEGKKFIILAVVFYGAMALVGGVWYRIAAGGSVLHYLSPAERLRPGGEFGLLAAAFLASMVFDTAGPRYSKVLRRFQQSLRGVLDPLGSLGQGEILTLSILSGLGEEILFRGALQHSLGFVPATILFALSHYPLKRDMWVWPIYALCMGAVLGTLRILGGDIWSAVLLHASVNFVSLYLLAGGYSSGKKADEAPNENHSDGAGDGELHGDGH